ncbi:hypothetical protein HRbin41_01009 [bacterium HR41]|nr:hypothetical protein HRbin41_01009 [bacterium HR41]
MWRPGPAEGAQAERAWVDAALDGQHAHGLGHFGTGDVDDALGALLGRHLERPRKLGDRPVGGGCVDRKLAPETLSVGQVAEHDVSVCARRRPAAPAIAGGPGVRTGRHGPDAQRAARVAPGDRAAAGADGVHLDHRQRERTAGHLATEDDARATRARKRDIARSTAHVEPDGVGEAFALREAGARDSARCRSRKHRPGAVSGGDASGRHAAAGEHHLGRRQAVRAGALLEALEVGPQARRHGGVDDRRRAALVLADDARGLARQRDVGVWQTVPHELADGELVLRVAKRPQQADGDRLGVDGAQPGAQRGPVEGAQDAVRPGSLGHADAQRGRDDRLRRVFAEAVERGAVLAAQLLEVLEPLGCEQRGRRELALEQGVGADGRSMHEAGDRARLERERGERALDRGQRALRLVGGRAGCFRLRDLAAAHDDGVAERPADVDADDATLALSCRHCAGKLAPALAAKRPQPPFPQAATASTLSKRSSRCLCEGQ